MKEEIKKLIEKHGIAAVLWALHDVVNADFTEAELEIKLAECAEHAQEKGI